MIDEPNPEADVQEFIDKFEASKDSALWENLIREEANEVREAFGNLMKEVTDLVYVIIGYSNVTGNDIPKALQQEMKDIEAIMNQFDPPDEVKQEAWRRVHASNMSKLGEDGKPIRRSDGKILKGPNYKPADMSGLIKN